jgi:hypothetical protein
MAEAVTLVHPNATLQVPVRLLTSKCDLFGGDPGLTAFPYHLKSQICVSDFREFVSALKGTTVKVTNNNFRGLSQLCEEFRFRDLDGPLSEFRKSGDFPEDAVLLPVLEERILAMEELESGKREAASLRRELSRLQESFEQRIRTEAESAIRRANELGKSVAEVRSDVETLRNALREVRDLAEGAQTKAASTAVQLERVARLEAEVSALRATPVVPAPAEPPLLRWNSAIVPDFPDLFEDFKKKTFTLLWRGSRDGFGARDFHYRCDWHPNTLTVILDTDGNIFGGFTPVEWDCSGNFKADPSLKSFLFTLKNPHNFPPQRFALQPEKKYQAIVCRSDCGPYFSDIGVSNNCNTNTKSFADCFGDNYTNDTELDLTSFFTSSETFQVREIEVFEFTE